MWDGRLLHDRVISIGEDATCRVWDYEGRCVQVMEGHRGRSIWSMAVDENTGLVVMSDQMYILSFRQRGGRGLLKFLSFRQQGEEIVELDYSH